MSNNFASFCVSLLEHSHNESQRRTSQPCVPVNSLTRYELIKHIEAH